jgi:hypothetical protein
MHIAVDALLTRVPTLADPTQQSEKRNATTSSAFETGSNKFRYVGQRCIDCHTYANPLALVKPLKIQESELFWLTTEQISALLEVIRNRCDKR